MISRKDIQLVLILTGMVFTLSSCSSIRLAVYDYQKRNGSTYGNTSITASPSLMASSSISPNITTEFKDENNFGDSFTQKASKYLGTHYKYGSCDPKNGFDCSGLVYHVAKSQNITLPRSSSSMATIGTHIPWKKAQPGDLIFFGDNNRIHHVGIVEKNKSNQLWIIHSSSSVGVTREDILLSDYWKKRVMFAMDISQLTKA
ncbi:MAG: C40 family peptidase [Bacteroidota bacterium]|nr:C40 family peptidase [Bacteroidota bacterium]